MTEDLIGTLLSVFMAESHALLNAWASYQIRKIAGCACAGNARNVSPRHRFQRKPLGSDHGMHHGTCVMHVPWCMSGSLTRSGGENFPGIPGACATRNFTYLVRGPWAWFNVQQARVRILIAVLYCMADDHLLLMSAKFVEGRMFLNHVAVVRAIKADSGRMGLLPPSLGLYVSAQGSGQSCVRFVIC